METRRRLEGRVAVVVGAGQTAITFLGEGALVVLADRDEPSLDESTPNDRRWRPPWSAERWRLATER